jgi:hypothetical protein
MGSELEFSMGLTLFHGRLSALASFAPAARSRFNAGQGLIDVFLAASRVALQSPAEPSLSSGVENR